jgi:hypothetical protein
VVLLTAVAPWLELGSYLFLPPYYQYPYAPVYSSATAGFLIVEIMKRKPNCNLLVLCARPGHFVTYRPLTPNVCALANQRRHAPHGVYRVSELDQ